MLIEHHMYTRRLFPDSEWDCTHLHHSRDAFFQHLDNLELPYTQTLVWDMVGLLQTIRTRILAPTFSCHEW